MFNKFSKLVTDVNNHIKNSENCNYTITLYTWITEVDINRIVDIDFFLKKDKPDMISFYNKKTNVNIEIYKNEIKGYEIKNNSLMINLKNKNVVNIENL